jgi:hypothetical protein
VRGARERAGSRLSSTVGQVECRRWRRGWSLGLIFPTSLQFFGRDTPAHSSNPHRGNTTLSLLTF